MNNYCYRLKLPAILNQKLPLISDHGLVPLDYSKTFYHRIENITVFNHQLFDWLDSLNLSYLAGGYFYVPENGSFLPHVDSRMAFDQGKFVDFCKINWRLGGSGSTATWYDILPEFELLPQNNLPESISTNSNNLTNFCLPKAGTIKPVFSVEHPEVCLLNPGRVHSFESGPCSHHMVSIAVSIKNSNKPLLWNDGIKIFKDYIVNQ
jgi:hypothetical protein